MNKYLTWLIKTLTWLFRTIYALLAVVIILAAAWILGGRAFLNQGSWGTDFGQAFLVTAWLDKFFPEIPFWNHLIGGGLSISQSYPTFGFWLVCLLKRLSGLELVQAFRLLVFTSVPLMALGIYALVSQRFKNQTAGLLAGLVYLVSPIAWVWLFDWGFYAESIAHIFIPPAIIFWDLFFMAFVVKPAGKGAVKGRAGLWLALSVVFTSLSTLSHYIAGQALLVFFSFWIIGYALKPGQRKSARLKLKNKQVESKDNQSKQSQSVLARGLLALVLVSLLSLTLTSFKIVPFYRYSQLVARAGGGGGKSLEQLKASRMTNGLVFGFRHLTEEDQAARHISFPLVVSLLAVLGVIVSLWKRKLLAFSLFGFFSLFLAFNPTFLYYTSFYLPWPFSLVPLKRASLLILRIVLPVLAGLGAVGIFKLMMFWAKGPIVKVFKNVLACLAGLALVWSSLYYFGSQPRLGRPAFEYGGRGIKLGNLWNRPKNEAGEEVELSLKEQLSFKNWPRPKIADQIPDQAGVFKDLEKTLTKISQENSRARIDISVFQASFGMLAPYYFNLDNQGPDNELTQLYTYANSSPLLRQFWSQQINAFYDDNSVYEDRPVFINNLARWFGIDYLFLNCRTKPDLFKKGGWQIWQGDWRGGVIKFGEENPLVELTNRPVVLVVGQDQVGAYNQIFRLANLGALPYREYFFVWGRSKIDSYNLEELKGFEVVLLHGYNYNNFLKTNQLLKDYVETGGRLFIDTGWQYTVPDWQTKEDESSLAVVPFDQLAWRDLGKTKDFKLKNFKVEEEIKLERFRPLIYQGQPWGVSTNQADQLKNWARPVLEAKDYPLVVKGELGRGKVVWSGMNLFAHARQKEKIYWEEVEFLNQLFAWLTKGQNRADFKVDFQRFGPGQVEFEIKEAVPQGAVLLWKEAYHPDFKASLKEKGLKGGARELMVYPAGPNLVLIKLPKLERGSKVSYQYHQPFFEKVLNVFSLLSLILLLSAGLESAFRKEKSLFNQLLGQMAKASQAAAAEVWQVLFGWLNKIQKPEDQDY